MKENNIITIEFKDGNSLSEFIKTLMDSKNGKECFVKLGHNGNDYYVDLKQSY